MRETGEPDNPTIVAVHGYPDNQTLWQGVVDQLADRFHVVTYDVRGMGKSTSPSTQSGYDLDQLGDDLATVITTVSPEQPVHLLAHDWGSLQVWHALTDLNWTVRAASYTSMSGPCLDQVAEWMRARWRNPTPKGLRELVLQLVLSSYIGFFHLPRIPETAWSSGILPKLIQLLERNQATADPQLSDAINGLELYRHNTGRSRPERQARATEVPVQIIAPSGDPFISPTLQTEVGNWASRVRIRRPRGGHWLPRSKPSTVARLVTEFVDDQ